MKTFFILRCHELFNGSTGFDPDGVWLGGDRLSSGPARGCKPSARAFGKRHRLILTAADRTSKHGRCLAVHGRPLLDRSVLRRPPFPRVRALGLQPRAGPRVRYSEFDRGRTLRSAFGERSKMIREATPHGATSQRRSLPLPAHKKRGALGGAPL